MECTRGISHCHSVCTLGSGRDRGEEHHCIGVDYNCKVSEYIGKPVEGQQRPPLGTLTGRETGVGREPESIEWFIEGRAFSRSYDFAPRPSPHPTPLPLLNSTGDTQEDWARENLMAGEWEGGWAEEPTHTTAWSSIHHAILSGENQWEGGYRENKSEVEGSETKDRWLQRIVKKVV